MQETNLLLHAEQHQTYYFSTCENIHQCFENVAYIVIILYTCSEMNPVSELQDGYLKTAKKSPSPEDLKSSRKANQYFPPSSSNARNQKFTFFTKQPRSSEDTKLGGERNLENSRFLQNALVIRSVFYKRPDSNKKSPRSDPRHSDSMPV